MANTFEVRDVEEVLIATGRDQFDRSNLIEKAMALSNQVWEFLRSHPEISQPGINVWFYPGGGVIEAGAQVMEPFESDGPVFCSHTPAGKAVVATHMGPYEKMGETYAACKAWIEENNLKLAGPSWEVYGHWDEDPNKLRTDIFHLIVDR